MVIFFTNFNIFFFLKRYRFFLKKWTYITESFFSQNFIKSLIYWKIKYFLFLFSIKKKSLFIPFSYSYHLITPVVITKFPFIKSIYNLFLFFIILLLLQLFVKIPYSFQFIHNYILVSNYYIFFSFYNQRLFQVHHF